MELWCGEGSRLVLSQQRQEVMSDRELTVTSSHLPVLATIARTPNPEHLPKAGAVLSFPFSFLGAGHRGADPLQPGS